MESIAFNFKVEEGRSVYTTSGDAPTTTTESGATSCDRNMNKSADGLFSPLAPPFQSMIDRDLMNLMHEPQAAATAPAVNQMEESLMNLRLNGSDVLYDETEHNAQNLFLNANRAESLSSTHSIWSEPSTTPTARNAELLETFDFLLKSMSCASHYVSSLTREQLSVMRAIRPSLLYELLLDISKLRCEKRIRRAQPNECAFCKNNGENEECYMSHVLKDWRGKVLCPVLRAFRCPRCGATGDRAHTIKYCPENVDGGLERQGSLLSRRRAASSASLLLNASRVTQRGGTAPATPTPSPSPTTNIHHSILWSAINMN